MVSFEGWHDEFEGDDASIDCFMQGLTPGEKLTVTRRGGYATSGPGGWARSTVALTFWRRKEKVVLQNR